jgi:GntR family transcriptional repressor for pyruvate dehydrogenase complex
MAGPIARVSVPDQVFDRLREAILDGEYGPGERLPSQRALAADLAVNMSTVREALGRLEQLRLVRVRHGEATTVLDWRRCVGLEALVPGARAGGDALGDLFEARRLLLVESARLAARRRSDAQAAALLGLAEAVGAAREAEAALLSDWSFMATLVESAGNLVFQLIMNSVRELYLPHAEAFAALVSHPRELEPLYTGAAVAVGERDAGAAAAAVQRLVGAQERAMGR